MKPLYLKEQKLLKTKGKLKKERELLLTKPETTVSVRAICETNED